MSLLSSSLQTPATDFNVTGILDGKVTSIDVIDPTENPPVGEKTSLLEVDDPFDVTICWELDGASTTVVGGSWFVSLYSANMDGVGAMTGLIAGPTAIPITGGTTPLRFSHTFHVLPPTPQVGLYKLTVTINHSPVGDPDQVTEMFGFAESTPIDIRKTVVEST